MKVLELSLVIPCHNEEKNLQPLLWAIHETLDPLGLDYEVVITDDCSTDNSWSVLKEIAASDPRLRIQVDTSLHWTPIFRTTQRPACDA
jgi:glycosyltransferase involved in cell wall biosynthesis